MTRYIARSASNSIYEVTDASRSNSIDGDYVVCECRDHADAETIALALNLVDGHCQRIADMKPGMSGEWE